MAIDINNIFYEVQLITETGKQFDLTEVLQRLSWEENSGELAQRCNLSFTNIKYDGTYLSSTLKLGCKVLVHAKVEQKIQTVFSGIVWDWRYESDSSKTITIMAYDNLIFLQKSKDNFYFRAGLQTNQILSQICSKWEIPFQYMGNNVQHSKHKFNGYCISDMIVEILDEAVKKGAQKCIIHFSDGSMCIKPKGTNTDIYFFESEVNTIKTTNRITMDGLVTRVVVVGKEDKDGRVSNEGIVNGKIQFGVLQDIYHRQTDTTLAQAKAAAQEIINTKGTPKEDISVAAPDIPFLRKGDKIKISAGNIIGYFYIKGIGHDATSKTMTMEVERV